MLMAHAAIQPCLPRISALLVPSSHFCLLSQQASTDPLSTALIGANCTFLLPLHILIMAVPQLPDGFVPYPDLDVVAEVPCAIRLLPYEHHLLTAPDRLPPQPSAA